jgi:hypothetical protein
MQRLRIIDSITQLSELDSGCIAVTGSHGGLSAARYALAARPLLTVFNDAGVGKDEAGVAALSLLQEAGLAACTVAHTSACIGDARSTYSEGIISHVNAPAADSGVHVGQSCQAALQAMAGRY